MTLFESLPAAPGHAALVSWSDADTRVLAAALSHVLRRDDECPARWRTVPFVDAVELARSELRSGAPAPTGLMPETDVAHAIDFHDAVTRLARNPVDVAVAIHHVELAERRLLPSWSDLVRHGLPSRTSDLDVALWFG